MSNAKVIATGDHIEVMKIPDGHYATINIGGVQHVGDVDIYAAAAMHSVTPGHACGYVTTGRVSSILAEPPVPTAKVPQQKKKASRKLKIQPLVH